MLAANLTTSGFSLDSQAGRPYHLNHKQVLTGAFPSNLILPYIALARARGLSKQAGGVEWGPQGPRSEPGISLPGITPQSGCPHPHQSPVGQQTGHSRRPAACLPFDPWIGGERRPVNEAEEAISRGQTPI
jgi:hypothetical protein